MFCTTECCEPRLANLIGFELVYVAFDREQAREIDELTSIDFSY